MGSRKENPPRHYRPEVDTMPSSHSNDDDRQGIPADNDDRHPSGHLTTNKCDWSLPPSFRRAKHPFSGPNWFCITITSYYEVWPNLLILQVFEFPKSIQLLVEVVSSSFNGVGGGGNNSFTSNQPCMSCNKKHVLLQSSVCTGSRRSNYALFMKYSWTTRLGTPPT